MLHPPVRGWARQAVPAPAPAPDAGAAAPHQQAPAPGVESASLTDQASQEQGRLWLVAVSREPGPGRWQVLRGYWLNEPLSCFRPGTWPLGTA